MTAEPDRMTLPPGARIVFLDALAPLPLADPTQAARFLNVRRHTLACYRDLSTGPVHYKLGRWIRYAWADLRQWSGLETFAAPRVPPPPVDGTTVDALALVDTLTAARFLTLTRFCLDNHRKTGGGPPFCRYGRRLYYPVDGLHRWAQAQRIEPRS